MNEPTSVESTRARVREWVALVVLAFALSTFAWSSALAAFPNTQGGDGPQHQKLLESAMWTVRRYHEFPGWNAFECGGVPLWDNPQFFGGPIAWLGFLVGSTRMMELWYLIHAALGFMSMWVLLRKDLRLSQAACLIGSAMWAFNGFHQQHYGHGHAGFVAFEYFPLALFFWRAAERNLRYGVWLGVLLAWMMYEGAAYPLPHLGVMLGVETLLRLWPIRRLGRIALAGVVVVVVALLVGAARFIPVLHQLKIHHRNIPLETDRLFDVTIKDMFLARDRVGDRAPGERWEWHEYGAFVGPCLLFLSVVGLLAAGLENLWLVVVLVVCFAFMMGHFASWAPWSLVNGKVFPFKEMRVPSRFRAEVTLGLGAFAALAVDRIPALFSRPRVRRLLAPLGVRRGHVRLVLVMVGLIGVGDMLAAGLIRFPTKFMQKPMMEGHVATRLYFDGQHQAELIDQPQRNLGRRECWDEWGFESGAPLWDGDVTQVHLVHPDQAKVDPGSARTPNSFTFVVDAKQPTRVLLNSSYDANWSSDVGHAVREGKGLAVDVPAGRSKVRVHYWPYGLTLGLVLSISSTLAIVAFFGWEAWKGMKRAAPPVATPGTPSSPPTPPTEPSPGHEVAPEAAPVPVAVLEPVAEVAPPRDLEAPKEEPASPAVAPVPPVEDGAT